MHRDGRRWMSFSVTSAAIDQAIFSLNQVVDGGAAQT
jgi:hypothetical protein